MRPISGLKRLAAYYKDSDEIYFQFGHKRWSLDRGNVVLEHEHLQNRYFSRFSVRENGRVVLAFRYPHILTTLYIKYVDPTYDYIDYYHDFFLAFLAEVAPDRDWRDAVRKSEEDASKRF